MSFRQCTESVIFALMKLQEHKDPMGHAIRDYFENEPVKALIVSSSMFEDDEMPVANLFRTEKDMPGIEQKALALCKGRILDVGAGAGCHALALQARGMDVTAIDISPLSVETMRRRGIRKAEWADFFTDDFGNGFDTILLLMNGMGIAGNLKGLKSLLLRCKELLAPDGCILADSSDLRYIYEDEDGQLDWDPADGYYGEVDFQMSYGKCKGPSFDWLYVDFDTLKQIAETNGMKVECIMRGMHYDYLARIKKG